MNKDIISFKATEYIGAALLLTEGAADHWGDEKTPAGAADTGEGQETPESP